MASNVVPDDDFQKFVLTLDCPDRRGIVHAVAGFVLSHSGNIVESQQFEHPLKKRFFMRVKFEVEYPCTPETLDAEFSRVAAEFGMNWRVTATASRVRTLILVSQLGHCLNDLLFRHRAGSLPIDVVGVVSNHRAFEQLAAASDIPFHYLPVTPETKADAESALLQLVMEQDVELVVLARYMQILSTDLCKHLEGRVINIHHSFLPSFKGAKPYHQAYARGVKLIGATAHYVTADLDEGPIIEQDVVRVNHSDTPEELVTAGRDIECQVLARAVKWHGEHRVLLDNDHTVVFR
jgi:formyltetrahydrofolate deformylase